MASIVDELNIVNLNYCNADLLSLLNEYNKNTYVIMQVLCNANYQACLWSIYIICLFFYLYFQYSAIIR